MKITLSDITKALYDATPEEREAYLGACVGAFTPSEIWRWTLRYSAKAREAGVGSHRIRQVIHLEDGTTWVEETVRHIATGGLSENWMLLPKRSEGDA